MAKSSKIRFKKVEAFSLHARRLTVIICYGGRENKCQTVRKDNKKKTDILARTHARVQFGVQRCEKDTEENKNEILLAAPHRQSYDEERRKFQEGEQEITSYILHVADGSKQSTPL